MRAVDTNVLVRILTRDDPRQAERADRFVENGAWISILALAEAVWVLREVYDRGPAEIAATVQMLLDHTTLTLQEPEVVEAALGIFKKRPALGFSDCLLLEIARRAGNLPLGTFDRTLGKVAGAERLSQ
ncbi:MAG: type II toxin-antitoxin system VapC family toxin [Acidobacteria bacterium]|nr:type II toxin-antitoxin system VapC family toxin [Acidobacteriota bacterium]